jgi:hypothetical protein
MITVKFECDGCDATIDGCKTLQQTYEEPLRTVPLRGAIEDMASKGWVAFDPYTHCTYCPECWKEIMDGLVPDGE